MGGITENIPLTLAISVGKALLFIGLAIILGRWVLPWLLGRVGGVRARELFLLTVLVLCLGAAISTHLLGLSIVFGAFLVGMVLRETRFVHQALAEITPLRDIFATLFFVSLGMLLDQNWCKEVGLDSKRIGTHTLRKTWGYQARKKGITIEQISEKLGHRSSIVTKRYIGINQDEINKIEDEVCL